MVMSVLSSSNESMEGHMFVLSWARVQRVAMASVVSE